MEGATQAPMTLLTAPTRAILQHSAKRIPQHDDNSAQSDVEHVVYHIVRHTTAKPSVK